MSPRVPASGVSSAIVSMSPVMVQVIVARPVPRSSAIVSSETVTRVMSVPKAVTANMTTPNSTRW